MDNEGSENLNRAPANGAIPSRGDGAGEFTTWLEQVVGHIQIRTGLERHQVLRALKEIVKG